MTEIEMYKETIKAVNNEYQKVLVNLEDLLCNAYERGDIPLFGAELRDTEIVARSTLMTAREALKTHCDDLLEQIESEIKK